MASLRIEEPETALGHVRRMMDNVTIMKEQTAALLQQVEAGNAQYVLDSARFQANLVKSPDSQEMKQQMYHYQALVV